MIARKAILREIGGGRYDVSDFVESNGSISLQLGYYCAVFF
jgi:hypothetical protein